MTDPERSSESPPESTSESPAEQPSEEPDDERDLPTLDPQQRRAVDAYLEMDGGLVTLASVPGAGKSTVAGKAVAAELLERAADGDPRPHERLVSASFSREDASNIVPDVVAWIEELVDRGDAPAELDRADVDRLIDQLREAPRIGTVDSVLRSVFRQIATSVGFGGMPTVGNAALLQRVHTDTFEAVSADFPDHLDRLHEAYPDGEWDAGVEEMLRNAFRFRRRHDLSIEEFERRLRAAIERNYGDDEPEDFDDVLDAVARYRGEATAGRVAEAVASEEEAAEKGTGEEAVERADGERGGSETDDGSTSRDALVAADRRIYREWTGVVGTFVTVLERYGSRYDATCKERGVVSHLDCAYWVDRFFSLDAHDGPRRERLLARYHDEIESAVVDEAQDVSRIQHDALAHLIDADTRVLLAGDIQQCIYQWRDATPELFSRAIEDGEYFGRTWETRTSETADRNYRSRPGIVRFANAVADRTLNHPERGGLGEVDAPTPTLYDTRDAGEGPSIHVAAFSGNGTPGSKSWVDPDRKGKEASVVATYVAGAVADGRLNEDGETPSITVLFAERRHMDAYATCFERQGFTVANASAHLFASPAVRAVVAAVEWLVDPADPDRTRTLATDSALAGVTPDPFTDDYEGLDPALDALRAADWSITDAVGKEPNGAADGNDADDRDNANDADDATIPPDYRTVLGGLADLAADARSLAPEPAAVVVREVVDRLRLEADPLGIDPETDRTQRVATLDALVALVAEWEGDDRYDNAELCTLFEPFLERPRRGPTQPVADPDAVDVVFRTVHSMKGDQDEVVVLADTAARLGPSANDTDRFATAGGDAVLAPPVSAVEGAPDLPEVAGGLYAPDASPVRKPGPDAAGLRWRPEFWKPSVGDGETDELVGPPVRREAAAADRSESWRTLHVALTRASNHLVVPLPRDDDALSDRNHWASVLYDVLGAGVVSTNGVTTADLPDGDGTLRETRVSVNDVPLDGVPGGAGDEPPVPPLRRSDPVPATDRVGDGWLPRFVGPSTLGPLVDDPAAALVSTLRGAAVHTESEAVDDALPLTFETVTTDAVGTVVHDLVAALADASVTADDLDGAAGREVADDFLVDHDAVENADEAETDGLREYLHDWVLPDLATSDLWERVDRAERVYPDEPLQAVTRIAGVEVEVQGEADLLLVLPDGTRCVEDVKATLAAPTDDQRRRYRTQVDVYAWTVGRQVGDDVRVVPRVTTVGVAAGEYGPDGPVGAWREAVRGLADRGRN